MHTTTLVAKASELGCALDCDLTSGLKNDGSGAASTDDTAILNAFLGQGTASRPVQLIIDGGASITGLFLPSAGHASIVGSGHDTGFFMRSGSNQDAIHNGGASAMIPWDPATTPPARSVGNVRLANFRINGNRGNGTTGNSTSGNPRGVSGSAWYCGISLLNLIDIQIEGVAIYDSPSYAIRMSNCAFVTINGVRIDSPSGDVNCDAFHFCGPAENIAISNCPYVNSGSDDAVALNAPEGYGGNISDVTVSNCNFVSCGTMTRVYANQPGRSFGVVGVVFANCTVSAKDAGIVMQGDTPVPGNIDAINDVHVANCIITAPQLASIGNNVGSLDLSNVTWDSPPTYATSWFSLAGGINVSRLSVANCNIKRTPGFTGPANVISGTGSIEKLMLNGFSVDDQFGQAFTPLAFASLTGTVNRLVINSLDTSLIGSLGTLTANHVSGPGVLATGFTFADAQMANGTMYLSATTSKPTIKLGGTVETLTMTP